MTVREGKIVEIQLADEDGDSIVAYRIVSSVSGSGALLSSSNGLYLYPLLGDNPVSNENFTYQVQDERGSWSASAVVTILVENVNDAPTIQPDQTCHMT